MQGAEKGGGKARRIWKKEWSGECRGDEMCVYVQPILSSSMPALRAVQGSAGLWGKTTPWMKLLTNRAGRAPAVTSNGKGSKFPATANRHGQDFIHLQAGRQQGLQWECRNSSRMGTGMGHIHPGQPQQCRHWVGQAQRVPLLPPVPCHTDLVTTAE